MLTSRVRPHDFQAERQVLAAMLINPESIQEVKKVVNQNDFELKNGYLFECFCHLGLEVDLIKAAKWLKERELHCLISPDDLVTLIDETSTSGGCLALAHRVRHLSQRRHLMDTLQEVIETLSDKDNQKIDQIEVIGDLKRTIIFIREK